MRQGVNEEAVSSFVGRGVPTGVVFRLGARFARPTSMHLDYITRGGNSLTKPERFPDFFLIGAPRCGTTALSSYLADNPPGVLLAA